MAETFGGERERGSGSMRGSRVCAALVLTTSLYLPMVATQVAYATCRVWRWPVKTLTDPDRRKVEFVPVATSVRRFRVRTRPGLTFGTDTLRTGRVEFHTWELKARPIQAKLEDDQDIHLVISVPGTVSPSVWLYLGSSVAITGVGFWDEQHGQTGIAPNGIELHPVLNIKGDCHRVG
jgi:hypothetical protein